MVVIVLLTLCLIALCFIIYRKEKRAEILQRNISFIDSIRLTGFPIISLGNNGLYVNMILDTGSNRTIINTNTLKDLEYECLEADSQVFGLNGQTQNGGYVRLPLYYNNQKYSIDCCSMDMEQTFSKMKQQFGVTIHGIIGTDFFEKYKYVLDFNKMVAYSISRT